MKNTMTEDESDDVLETSARLIADLTQGRSPLEVAKILICTLTLLHHFNGGVDIEQTAEQVRRSMIIIDKNLVITSEGVN